VRRPPSWTPFAFFALLALVALLLAGSQDRGIRSFAVGVPSIRKVAVARAHHPVCEGPIRSQYAFRTVILWGRYVSGTPHVSVADESPGSDAVLSSGPVGRSLPGAYGSFTAPLSNPVAGGRTVRVCVSDPGGMLRLRGAAKGYSGVAIAGSRRTAFSMVLLEPQQHSLIGSLGIAFSRAALFRPSWVGPWTFWALLVLLLGTVGLGAVAISAAIRSEGDQAESTSAE
jgi:hypothetical protein